MLNPLDLNSLPDDALLTRKQLIPLCGFAEPTLKRWSAEGRGPKITRVEGRPRFRVADVTEQTAGTVSLVVIDTVSRSIPGADENAQSAMTQFVKACETLSHRFGAAVLAVHHSSKTGGLRGSTVLQGAAYVVLRVKKGDVGRVRFLKCEKSKDGEDGWTDHYAFDEFTLGEGKTSLVPRRLKSEGASPMQAKTAQALAAIVSGVLGERSQARWVEVREAVKEQAIDRGLTGASSAKRFRDFAVEHLSGHGVETSVGGQTVCLQMGQDAPEKPWFVQRSVVDLPEPEDVQ